MNQRTSLRARPAGATNTDDLNPFAHADLRLATWQLVNTCIPYLALLVAMYWTVYAGVSYWVTLALAIPTAGLQIRVFIFFHDACHGSFFASQRANRILGYVTGVLTFTPYDNWRRSHGIHHSSVGDLDRRGVGDVMTWTVDEYLTASPLKRLGYRLYRHPVVMFLIGPLYVFIVSNRLLHKGFGKRENRSVWITNAAILALLLATSAVLSFRAYVLVQLPVIWLSGIAGVWLFYVQHQFPNVYWARHQDWIAAQAARQGSSHYRLPRPLQWISGSIGLHHIHHLKPRIPNYRLQACYDAIPSLQEANSLSIGTSLRCLGLKLWDEARGRLIGWRELGRSASPSSS